MKRFQPNRPQAFIRNAIGLGRTSWSIAASVLVPRGHWISYPSCISGTVLVALCVCLLLCGCKVASGVKSTTTAIDANRRAIEESTTGVEAIGQAITNSVPAIEAAQQRIEGAAVAIAAVRPAIQDTTTAIEQARHGIEQSSQGIEANRLAIEASTRSISANQLAVDQSTASLERIGRSLDTLLDALDRLTARKGLIGTLLIGGATLILISFLPLLLCLWRLNRTTAALTACLNQLQNLSVTAFKKGEQKP